MLKQLVLLNYALTELKMRKNIKTNHTCATYKGTVSSACTLHTTFPRTTFSIFIPSWSCFNCTCSSLTVCPWEDVYDPPLYGPKWFVFIAYKNKQAQIEI